MSITLGDNVQIGHSITGTIALSNPKSLSGNVTVGLSGFDVPPPAPQTTPPTPAATGMVDPVSVTVPGDGSSVSFTVKGSSVSAFLNDVYIRASSGAISNRAFLTVWNIGPATCTAMPDDQYYIGNSGDVCALFPLGPRGKGDSVTMQASAGITPSSAPLAWLGPAYPGAQIGVVQNVLNGAVYSTAYGNPIPVWNAGVASGTVGYAWSGWSNIITVPACVDTLHDGSPFPMPYDALGPISSLWTSTDGPSSGVLYNGTTALMAADNATVLGHVSYTVTNLSLKANFTDWCCIVNGTTSFPASTGWSINVAAAPPIAGIMTALGVHVGIGGGGGAPITSGLDANQYGSNFQNCNPPVTPSPTRISFKK